MESTLTEAQAVLAHIVRRHRLTPDEADDFGGEVMVRLLDNDSGILRKHDGKNSLKAYLTVVIQRMLYDYRRKQWGRWRPSAAATRIGPVALRLEELVYKDGHSFSDACRFLRERFGYEESEEQLGDIWAKLPVRVKGTHRPEHLESFVEPPSDDGDPQSEALTTEQTDAISSLYRLLAALREELPDEDALILSLRFERGFSVSKIARALNLPQRSLFRRIRKLLEQLKESMLEAGVTAESVNQLLGDDYDAPVHKAKIRHKPVSDSDG